jgi:2-(1,2-epoxy-1,2-dihydrophenyl)acetyl-CoA isomerase
MTRVSDNAPATSHEDKLSREYQTVNVYRRGAGAKLELNRPQRMNAWSDQFSVDLLAAIREAADDPEVRAVTITGAGRAFSSGADLKEAMEQGRDGKIDVYRRLTERYHPIITGIRQMPKPVVAAVNGPAAGIGLSLALACDLVVAKESAYFQLAFVNIGLAPDGAALPFVAARVGAARAAEMAMLGDRIPAALALRWGLINTVVADAEFGATSDALVERLAHGPTRSYANTKSQLNSWLYPGLDDQLQLEAALQVELATTEDFAEGVAAFLQKRPAHYHGT